MKRIYLLLFVALHIGYTLVAQTITQPVVGYVRDTSVVAIQGICTMTYTDEGVEVTITHDDGVVWHKMFALRSYKLIKGASGNYIITQHGRLYFVLEKQGKGYVAYCNREEIQ